VLIVQLKRFKYDRTSRRKLNNHVDFPMYDLDLYDYLASSRQQTLSRYVCVYVVLCNLMHFVHFCVVQ